jgi:hypothetical protein
MIVHMCRARKCVIQDMCYLFIGHVSAMATTDAIAHCSQSNIHLNAP